MPYSPTDWVDGVTPVDASRLDKMEAGIVAAEESAKKAQPNGYASLDSGGKVPLAQLPPVGNDLVYEGAHVPATAYTDGDIVVANNVSYLCVKATNAAPVAWPGGPTPAAPQTIPYGTSLPASPADGQEAILVDSVTNPSYQWRFRFNAQSSSAYKWEFVGGAPAQATIPGSVNETLPPGYVAGAWADLATAGPQIVAPRAGEYIVDGFVGYLYNHGVPAGFAFGVGIGTGAPVVTGYAASYAANLAVSVRGVGSMIVAAADQIRMRYSSSVNGDTSHFPGRVLLVAPRRVS